MPEKKNTKLSPVQHKRIQKLAQKGLTGAEIAKIIGCNSWQVTSYLRRPTPEPVEVTMLHSQYLLLLRFKEGKFTTHQLATYLGGVDWGMLKLELTGFKRMSSRRISLLTKFFAENEAGS